MSLPSFYRAALWSGGSAAGQALPVPAGAIGEMKLMLKIRQGRFALHQGLGLLVASSRHGEPTAGSLRALTSPEQSLHEASWGCISLLLGESSASMLGRCCQT